MAAALSTSENVSAPSPRAPPSVLSSPSTLHKPSITHLTPALFSSHSLILVCSTKHCSPLGRVCILLFVSLLAWWPCTGWDNSTRNKVARVGNRGTRRKMPREKELTHTTSLAPGNLAHHQVHTAQSLQLLLATSWKPHTGICTQAWSVLLEPHLSYLNILMHCGFGTNAVAFGPLMASPLLSLGRGRPHSSCRCPKVLLSLFTHSTSSCLKDFLDFMHLNHFEKHYLPSL